MKFDVQLNGKLLYLLSLHFIIVLLGVEVFVLGKQNAELKRNQEYMAVGRLKVGDFFRVDSLWSVFGGKDGPPVFGQKQVIFVFSTKCRICSSNLDAWQTIASEARKCKTSVYAVSLDSIQSTIKYVQENRIMSYSVFVPRSARSFSRDNRISGIPLTVLRGSQGYIENIWLGAIGTEEVREICREISQ